MLVYTDSAAGREHHRTRGGVEELIGAGADVGAVDVRSTEGLLGRCRVG